MPAFPRLLPDRVCMLVALLQNFPSHSPSACFAALLATLTAQGGAAAAALGLQGDNDDGDGGGDAKDEEEKEDITHLLSAQLTLLAQCAKAAKPAFLAARETEAVALLSRIIRGGCAQASGMVPGAGENVDSRAEWWCYRHCIWSGGRLSGFGFH